MKSIVSLLALAAVAAAASSSALAAETVRSITLATGSAHERPATVSDMQRKFTATGPLCKDPNTGLFVFCNKVSPANATPANEGPSGLLQPIKDAVLADLNSAFNLAVQQDQQSVTAAGYAAPVAPFSVPNPASGGTPFSVASTNLNTITFSVMPAGVAVGQYLSDTASPPSIAPGATVQAISGVNILVSLPLLSPISAGDVISVGGDTAHAPCWAALTTFVNGYAPLGTSSMPTAPGLATGLQVVFNVNNRGTAGSFFPPYVTSACGQTVADAKADFLKLAAMVGFKALPIP